ncbi:MAG TPA: NAD-dependent epimerase/dehydratase family protein [Micromonosporaceae bacterium]|nr:NAD-dependent epimerase/dehydratase family protein [Micromonosporaceae bacterium]
MRVVVTGGAGFIGSHLVDRLVADGAEVLVLDHLRGGHRANLAAALGTGRVSLVRQDVTDPGLVGEIAEAAPDTVFHLAAQIDVRASVADPTHDATSNVLGTVAVLEAARRAGVRKVVFVSSVAVYGSPITLPVTEDALPRPLSPYAVSKLAGEFYMHQYRELHGLDTTVLTLSNTYGPKQDPHGEAGVVAIFADALLSGGPTRVYGDGGNLRDYVYVGDVVDALVAAAARPGTGRRVNIGTGRPTSDLELHRLVADAVGVRAEPGTAPARQGDLREMVLDASVARGVLGWAPRTPLADGIKLTVEALRARR